MLTLFLLTALLCVSVRSGGNVDVYFNECMRDLVLRNYHNYTGILLMPPVKTISKDSSVVMQRYEFEDRAIFGSLLTGNVNYDPAPHRTEPISDILVHLYISVNTTGALYAVLGPADEITGVACMDVPYNGGKLPTVIGVYAWYLQNQTASQCKAATPAISNCDHVVPLNTR